MGMPLELQTIIVTNGQETRIDGEEKNLFRLEKEGYRLYPLDVPMDIRKTKESDSSGTAIIRRLQWESGKTVIYYELVSLNSTN
ncbi:DUF2584 domain-containing protein [Aeribacillus pallidus]|jgi:hypothetical protein|uniref:DUF2584 domain-containing protein n=1 Tax=Aeribacillus pallidus TaxID=33936 RepID=UPI001DF3DCC7|nr:DUF2584 domain-containing protein [Bacillus sp. (in: firmicutes)]